MRSLQYLPWMRDAGFQLAVQPLLPDELLQSRYQRGSYRPGELLRAYALRVRALLGRRDFDLVWIEKEALPYCPAWVEVALLGGGRYVLDYDDALFHQYDQHPNPWVRRLLGQRLDRLMARAAMVICGNGYLAQRAHDAGAGRVEVLPTAVDLRRYEGIPSPSPAAKSPTDVRGERIPRIVWIGSPATRHYLERLHEPLRALASRRPFVLRVIGAATPAMPGVQTEAVPWTEDSEYASLCACDIGVMPLEASPWALGKCSYKLIQYMACGLPTVASAVGMNVEVVQHGKSGFLATTPQDWIDGLASLLERPDMRDSMGRAGRRRVEEEFCIQKTAPRLAGLLHSVCETSSRRAA